MPSCYPTDNFGRTLRVRLTEWLAIARDNEERVCDICFSDIETELAAECYEYINFNQMYDEHYETMFAFVLAYIESNNEEARLNIIAEDPIGW